MIDGIVGKFEIVTPEQAVEAAATEMRLLIIEPGVAGFVIKKFSTEQFTGSTLAEVGATTTEEEIG